MKVTDEVYREYSQMVYKYLFSLTGDAHVAEEVTQETFYQAVRSVGRYDGRCKVSTWLCQIAKHLWYQELERRRRKGTSELNEKLASSGADLSETVSIREEKMELFRGFLSS